MAARLTRRQALGRIGLGLGAGVLSQGCSLGPGPDVVCGAAPESAATSARDAAARALLSHIDTFVVLMLENRSFDHLLGGLRFDRTYPGAAAMNGLAGDESNLDLAGRPVQVAPMAGDGRGSFTPAHDWKSVHATFNGGRNDGFLAVNKGVHDAEVMSYLVREQVPYFHALADQFTVFDHWYASFLGPTWPNRFYLHATTSGGRRENAPMGVDATLSVWERLAQRCCSGRNYAAGAIPWYAAAFPTRVITGEAAMVPAKIEDFFADARAGNLPNLALIDPDFKYSDGSPMHSLALCEAFVASIVAALAESPQWSRSLLLIMFDEHGGYYDHAPPPAATDLRPEFRQLGFRVPAFAIGPTVRRGAVVPTVLEHVSIAATLRARFGIETLSERMDRTLDVADCIDPLAIAAPRPGPRNVERVTLGAEALAAAAAAGSSQPEVEAAPTAAGFPSAVAEAVVDRRSDDERMQGWLRLAQELDVVKVVR
jgi:phospholipase C